MTGSPIDRFPAEYVVERRRHAGTPLHIPLPVSDFFLDDEEALRSLHPDAARRGEYLLKLKSEGEIVVLDRITPQVDMDANLVLTDVPVLGLTKVSLPEAICKANHPAIWGGLWSIVKLAYDDGRLREGKPSAVAVRKLDPVRTVLPDAGDLMSALEKLDDAGWLRVLFESLGRRPESFSSRLEQLLFLCRLAPVVERNLNIAELGPQQTAKSFTLNNASPRVHVRSGGTLTAAELFINLNTNKPGLLALHHVVVIDECSKVRVADGAATVAQLKEFLESGRYSRGGQTFESDCSFVMMGNIKVERGLPSREFNSWLEVFPEPLRDPALWNRIHGMIPGWQLNTITPDALFEGKALAADVLAELFGHLRDQSRADKIEGRFDWLPGMTVRDVRAVTRIASGLLKLLDPLNQANDETTNEAVGLAATLRQRVHDQLVSADFGEFAPRKIGAAGLTYPEAPDLEDPLREPLSMISPEAAIVGQVNGLVGNEGDLASGATLVIEATLTTGTGYPKITGLHGDMLQHSVDAAWAFITRHSGELAIPESLLKSRIHVHMQRFWNRREGPSAGLAFAAAMVSCLTKEPVRQNWALTGSLGIFGEVEGVGAIAPKVIAAYKSGCSGVIIPAENADRIADIPAAVREKIQIVAVRTAQEAFHLLLV